MKAIDVSFERLTPDRIAAIKANGFTFVVQCLWTGGYAGNSKVKEVARDNLRDARDAGLGIAGYVNASPWREPSLWLREALANAGDMWSELTHVAVDFEIDGTPESGALALAQLLEAEGKKVCIYSAKWFWERAGRPEWSSLAKYPLWVAQYDGRPEGGSLFGPFTELCGKQFRSDGVAVLGFDADLNEFSDWWEDSMVSQADFDELKADIEYQKQRITAQENTLRDFARAEFERNAEIDARIQRLLDGLRSVGSEGK